MMDYTTFFENHIVAIKWGQRGEGLARCPFHEDRNPSLSVNQQNGLWYCHAGCGGGTAQEFAERLGVSTPSRRQRDPEAVYDYGDEEGKLLFQVVRFPGKRFAQRRPDAPGRWRWDLKAVRRIPYRLPELLKGTGPVFIVEGEKDVETLRRLDFPATTNPGGAGKWREEYGQWLRDRYCILVPDNDKVGRQHMETVARALRPYASRLLTLELPDLPEHGDITDWIAQGHTAKELLALIKEAECRAFGPSETVPHVPGPRSRPGWAMPQAAALERPSLPPFPDAAWVGLFREYRELVGPSTEAPDAFHYGTLLLTLGLITGRTIYLRAPHRLYPNFFVLIVGPTGDVRKTTAIRYGQDLWDAMGEEVQVVSNISSAEGIYEVLKGGEGTRLLIHEDELRILLGAAARPGTKNLLGHLCHLHGCPITARLTRREPVSVKEPFVSLIAATPKEWLEQSLETEAVFGGFLNRCLILTGEPKPYLAHPTYPSQEAWISFTERLRAWRQRLPPAPTEALWSAEGREKFAAWYVTWRKEREKLPDAHRALTRRTEEHIRKAALLYAVLRGRREIRSEDLDPAIKVGEHGEALAIHLFGHLTLPRQTHLEERILSLTPAEGIPRRLLQGKIGGNWTREEFARALETLERSGEIKVDPVEGTRGPRGSLIRRSAGG